MADWTRRPQAVTLVVELAETLATLRRIELLAKLVRAKKLLATP